MDFEAIRSQFPILQTEMNGHPLVYLDSAATSQKPQAVIDAMVDYYQSTNSNVHRGVYRLAAKATDMYEEAHEKVAAFIGSMDMQEVVFTMNTTHSLNMLARMLAPELSRESVVVISEMEHHSNIVPWQILQKEIGFKLEWVPLKGQEGLDLSYLEFLVNKYKSNIKVCSLVHQSNVLDSVVDIESVKKILSGTSAKLILDVSQSITHKSIDVKELGVDFVYFSGHKVYGPTGTGVLWGRRKLLEAYEPAYGGGEMISSVDKSGARWNSLPWKYEAGTPNIAGAIGLGAAIDWFISTINYTELASHYQELMSVLIGGLIENPDISIIGVDDVSRRNSLVSFTHADLHPHDVAGLLAEEGICVRAGYHCAEPLHKRIGSGPTARVSFGVYSTVYDVDQFLYAIRNIRL